MQHVEVMLRNMARLNRCINYCSFIWGGQKKIEYFFYRFVWEVISKTRASGFIRGSKHLETIKALGLRLCAFTCFSVGLEPLMKPSHSFLFITSKVWLNALSVFHKIELKGHKTTALCYPRTIWIVNIIPGDKLMICKWVYIVGNTGTHLFYPLHFVRHKGDWRPTRPPQRVSRVPDYLVYSIQSVLGLFQVRLIPHALL